MTGTYETYDAVRARLDEIVDAVNAEGVTLDEALALFRPEEKVFVIGGAQIYAQALPLCDEFYLTRVFHAYQGDTCFPRWDEREWEIIDSESFASGKEFPYPFAFEHYRRRK